MSVIAFSLLQQRIFSENLALWCEFSCFRSANLRDLMQFIDLGFYRFKEFSLLCLFAEKIANDGNVTDEKFTNTVN